MRSKREAMERSMRQKNDQGMIEMDKSAYINDEKESSSDIDHSRFTSHSTPLQTTLTSEDGRVLRHVTATARRKRPIQLTPLDTSTPKSSTTHQRHREEQQFVTAIRNEDLYDNMENNNNADDINDMQAMMSTHELSLKNQHYNRISRPSRTQKAKTRSKHENLSSSQNLTDIINTIHKKDVKHNQTNNQQQQLDNNNENEINEHLKESNENVILQTKNENQKEQTTNAITTTTSQPATEQIVEPYCPFCIPILTKLLTYNYELLQNMCSSVLNQLTAPTKLAKCLHELHNGVTLPTKQCEINQNSLKSIFTTKQSKYYILNIQLEKTEEIILNNFTSNPLLRISFIDLRTGYQWLKSDINRSVIYSNENERINNNKNNIMDILSLPSLTTPKLTFDENIIINEPLHILLNPYLIIFFELLDFGPKINLNKYPDGLKPICWAFLRIIGTSGNINLGKLRLQFYYYQQLPKLLNKQNIKNIYLQWLYMKNIKKKIYPSTLFISLNNEKPIKRETIHSKRSMKPNEIEIGRLNIQHLLPTQQSNLHNSINDSEQLLNKTNKFSNFDIFDEKYKKRCREKNENCLIPNHTLHELSTSELGSFSVKFSRNGIYLAISSCDQNNISFIKIYKTNNGKLITQWIAHHDLIYQLNWNYQNNKLISASSDTTVKIWKIFNINNNNETTTFSQFEQFELFDNIKEECITLQHTTFIYSAIFHPKSPLILTGGYDTKLRIWNENNGQCLITLTQSSSLINSIDCMTNGTHFYIGNAQGEILIYEDTYYTRDAKNKNELTWLNRFKLSKILTNERLKGNVISCLRYCSKPERLIVYCRDNCLYLINSLHGEIIKIFSGVPSEHQTLRCIISPDGNILAAGAEDGKIYFYDLLSGKLIKRLNANYNNPIIDIDWNNNQHLIVVASFGANYPVKCLEYIVKENNQFNQTNTLETSGTIMGRF